MKNGIKDELIRLSVGVEDQKDLLADLERGFNELKRSEKNVSDSKVHSQA
ncbi:cystathionine gamma-synthase domain protein [Lactobacillus delbrueckii subsp. lactis CRL581]|nr:cystathionine gamma-synthase domain protein [Lactobacillus delbrueckii subsp. lactis CRL581]